MKNLRCLPYSLQLAEVLKIRTWHILNVLGVWSERHPPKIKISSRGFSAKICTYENFPLYGNLSFFCSVYQTVTIIKFLPMYGSSSLSRYIHMYCPSEMCDMNLVPWFVWAWFAERGVAQKFPRAYFYQHPQGSWIVDPFQLATRMAVSFRWLLMLNMAVSFMPHGIIGIIGC